MGGHQDRENGGNYQKSNAVLPTSLAEPSYKQYKEDNYAQCAQKRKNIKGESRREISN